MTEQTKITFNIVLFEAEFRLGATHTTRGILFIEYRVASCSFGTTGKTVGLTVTKTMVFLYTVWQI